MKTIPKILLVISFCIFLPALACAEDQTKPDFAELELKAEQGDTRAEFQVGSYYHSGINGVEKDLEKAEYWYRKAVGKNHIQAQTNLGLLLLQSGYGDSQKVKEGFELILKSAEMNDPKAQLLAGMTYSSGGVVPQDFVKSVKWYKKAAEQGDFQAQFNLGVMYYQGMGVEKDLEKAKIWSQKAAEQGDKKAINFLRTAFPKIDRGTKTDQSRICDVLQIVKVIEEFKKKAGHYPYQEAYLYPREDYKAVPGAVNIYREELPEEYKWPPRGASGRIFLLEEFESYLASELGPIELPVDDRIVYEGSYPAFYQYMFDGNAYYVSAILNESRDDVRQVTEGLYKYQISSKSAQERNIKSIEEAEADCKK